jgi:esterase/lipase
LQQCCEEVFVAAFSLGSLLAVHLGVHHRMAGLALISPTDWVRDWRVRLLLLARHFVKFVLKDADPQHSDLTDPEAYKRFCYDSYPVAPAYQL